MYFSTVAFHYIPINNPVNEFILKYKIVQYILIVTILIWMFYIMKPSFIWTKSILIK